MAAGLTRLANLLENGTGRVEPVKSLDDLDKIAVEGAGGKCDPARGVLTLRRRRGRVGEVRENGPNVDGPAPALSGPRMASAEKDSPTLISSSHMSTLTLRVNSSGPIGAEVREFSAKRNLHTLVGMLKRLQNIPGLSFNHSHLSGEHFGMEVWVDCKQFPELVRGFFPPCFGR